jgi:hypothetical protein
MLPIILSVPHFSTDWTTTKIIVPFCKRPWFKILELDDFKIFKERRNFFRHMIIFTNLLSFLNMLSNFLLHEADRKTFANIHASLERQPL